MITNHEFTMRLFGAVREIDSVIFDVDETVILWTQVLDPTRADTVAGSQRVGFVRTRKGWRVISATGSRCAN